METQSSPVKITNLKMSWFNCVVQFLCGVALCATAIKILSDGGILFNLHGVIFTILPHNFPPLNIQARRCVN